MIDPARRSATRTARGGATVPIWETSIVLLFLIGPTIGVFWAPETYFAPQDFSIKTGASAVPAGGFTYASVANYLELLWLAFVYARQPSVMVNALVRSVAPLAFGLIVLLSATWSPDVSASFNRGVRLILVILMSIYLIERFTMEQITSLLAVAFAVAIVASVLAVILIPAYGFSNLNGYSDAWRGAFSHKNALGAAMSNGILIAFFAWRTRVLPAWLTLSTLLGATFLLVEARSATAGIAALIAIASVIPLAAIGSARRPEDKLLIGMGLVLCLLLLTAAVSYLDEILLFLGRNPTLTGRTEIWQSVWNLIQQNPWVGYGHAFWSLDSPLRTSLWTSLQWAVPHAHNTFLDLWFQTGLIGLVLAFCVTVGAIGRGIGLLFNGSAVVVTTFWLSILVNLVVRMFSETLLVDPGIGSAFWLCLAYVGLAKMRDEQRVRRARRSRAARLGREAVGASGLGWN